MKIKFEVWVCTDANGDKDYNVVKESNDWITLKGTDSDGRYQQFDSEEAYHSYAWAERNGFKVESFMKEVEV
jgi:hypothetical protein